MDPFESKIYDLTPESHSVKTMDTLDWRQVDHPNGYRYRSGNPVPAIELTRNGQLIAYLDDRNAKKVLDGSRTCQVRVYAWRRSKGLLLARVRFYARSPLPPPRARSDPVRESARLPYVD